MGLDYYSLLGVKRDANDDDIKKASLATTMGLLSACRLPLRAC